MPPLFSGTGCKAPGDASPGEAGWVPGLERQRHHILFQTVGLCSWGLRSSRRPGIDPRAQDKVNMPVNAHYMPDEGELLLEHSTHCQARCIMRSLPGPATACQGRLGTTLITTPPDQHFDYMPFRLEPSRILTYTAKAKRFHTRLKAKRFWLHGVGQALSVHG